jgi:hypothetical protein
MSKRALLSLLAVGLLGILGAAVTIASAQPGTTPQLQPRAVLPAISRGEEFPPTPTPTPVPISTPEPLPSNAPIASFHLESAGVDSSWPVEEGGIVELGGRVVLADPKNPQAIAWYPDYGRPGYRGGNTLVSGHLNWYTGIPTPFARLDQVEMGDALYITLTDGTQYVYTVVELYSITESEYASRAEEITYPPLDSYHERVTLISCGGDFYRAPNGEGHYHSRLLVIAERHIP